MIALGSARNIMGSMRGSSRGSKIISRNTVSILIDSKKRIPVNFFYDFFMDKFI